MSITELTKIGKDLDIAGATGMRKQELIFKILRRHGKHAIAVLKDERRDLLVDVRALFTAEPQQTLTRDQTTYQIWDIEQLDSWESYRKTARVIIVFDVSGSMGDLGGEGYSKLDLAKQAVQRFATLDDLEKHHCTIEEMEEYEPHIDRGVVIYAGVDYEAILRQAKARYWQTNSVGATELLSTNISQAGTLADEYQFWIAEALFQKGDLGAAAEAMRRILIDRARKKARVRHGGAELPQVAPRAGWRERALALFPGSEHVNVQPHSGSQANAAVYMAALSPGDTVLEACERAGIRMLPVVEPDCRSTARRILLYSLLLIACNGYKPTLRRGPSNGLVGHEAVLVMG